MMPRNEPTTTNGPEIIINQDIDSPRPSWSN